jgi:hypothetical protein
MFNRAKFDITNMKNQDKLILKNTSNGNANETISIRIPLRTWN